MSRQRRRGRRAVWIVAIVVVLIAAGAGAAVVVSREGEPALPRDEVRAYLAAWERFDAAAMAGMVDSPPAGFVATVSAMQDDTGITAAHLASGVLRRLDKDRVEAQYTATMDVAGLGAWEYTGTLELVRRNEIWRVAWTPASLHPALEPGLRFDRTRVWPVRAPILGADGTALADFTEVTLVGLQPERIRDRAQVDAVLKQHLNVEPAEITAALNAPGVQPTHFVRIAAVRQERFAPLRPILEPVPGIFFQRTRERLAIADDFAAHVLGRVGEITAERLGELKTPYVVGDQVGLSGLELNFERQLAGTPSGSVRLVNAKQEPVRTVFEIAGTPPQPVRTTIDRRVQVAAEQAIAGVTQPVGLVAIDAASGDIRAVVSRPLSEQFNRALAGQYPPGSTFKVVTTAALLGVGAKPENAVACPATATVGGLQFRNFEGEALGQTTLRNAFAHSCNTAFVSLAADLQTPPLTAAATAFGFGASYGLELPAAGGQFPAPGDTAERAAAAIGQARVLASPVHMASVAAAVAGGSWRPPRLLSDKPAGPAATMPLDPAVAASLRDLMAEVVRTGTGAAAAVAGAGVAGKTGTAEIGGPDPNVTHAWFIGFRGNLAFAVVVERGGVGGRVAAPMAARFLAAAP